LARPVPTDSYDHPRGDLPSRGSVERSALHRPHSSARSQSTCQGFSDRCWSRRAPTEDPGPINQPSPTINRDPQHSENHPVFETLSAEVGISLGTVYSCHASKPDLFLVVSLFWKEELSLRTLRRFDTTDVLRQSCARRRSCSTTTPSRTPVSGGNSCARDPGSICPGKLEGSFRRRTAVMNGAEPPAL